MSERRAAKNKRVLIIYTGGTLGMRAKGDNALAPADAQRHLLRWIPELRDYAEIKVKIVSNTDSSVITPGFWLDLAHEVEKVEQGRRFDGVVILHGTDTLAYSSSALSFLLPSLSLPVVLTGSQKPLAVTRTDARNNVLGAVESALEGPAEVMVFFRDQAYRGSRVTKNAITEFDAFSSPNYPELGRAGIHWTWHRDLFWPPTRRPAVWPPIPASLPDTPWVLPWVPGLNLAALKPAFQNFWAVVLEAFGTGNIPLESETRALLADYVKQGGLLLVRSQVPKGSTTLGAYEPGKALQKLGAVECLDLTREALVTKLMVLKGLNLDNERLKYTLTQSITGEMQESA